MNRQVGNECTRRGRGGGYPLAMTSPGESVVVLGCNTRDPDLNRHLSDMGIAPNGVVEVLSNENGRLTVLAGESRIGIDAALARKIRVSPDFGDRCHRHHHKDHCHRHRCGCEEGTGRRNSMKVSISADAMSKGQEGIVKQVKGNGAVNRRLRDMGLTPGSHIRCEGKAPLGDPIELEIMGYKLTLRKNEAEGVLVEVEG
jgi:ferrous iron transport protein A